jgi:hypothetical protein
MYGVRKASVWVHDIFQWVPLTQVTIIQFYNHEGRRCAQFTYEGKVQESYVEYKEI